MQQQKQIPVFKKISKEHNELKMKEVREFATNTATGQYHLNLHVLGLNYSSTFEEMKTGYPSMARRFHPDNNYGFDTTEMMTMINTAKEGFKHQLCKNDAVREEERDLAAEDVESIPSDHNSDSESSSTTSKPASSYSKESRQQNATAEANPSVTKFIKEQNERK